MSDRDFPALPTSRSAARHFSRSPPRGGAAASPDRSRPANDDLKSTTFSGVTPMASLGMNDVKTGQKILVNNDPCIITETEYVKPGKGQAFTRIKYRSIKSGRVVEMTMKATDNVEQADVVDTDMQFLYADGEYWHFMNQESFEQVQADKAGMGGAEKWLKGEEECVVTLWNGTPIAVQPPNFVELKIVETDPGVRGDTSGGGGKPATLETGAVVRVPLFVAQDELIKVDTRSGEYVSRVK
jgi:elongation factor P